MKPRVNAPTDQERILPAKSYIISTTDCSGRITSVNDVFVDYSGYTAEELIGVQHNIVRHPDMPRAIFSFAWDHLRDGEDFFGYMKNLSKDGGYYWVFAHIRPEHDSEGEIIGYRSIRRHPSKKAIAKISPLYAQMRAAELAVSSKEQLAAGGRVLSDYLKQEGMSYERMVASLTD